MLLVTLMTSTAFDTPSAEPGRRGPSAADLLGMMRDSRARTLELVAGLDDDRLLGPRLAIVNPLLWEIGHLAWFHEHFILRHLDRVGPLRADADALYDSSAVHHDTRWDLPLPTLAATLDYMADVAGALARRLAGREPTDAERDLYRLATFHEDMHGEAFTYSRQSLGWPAPAFAGTPGAAPGTGPWPGDVEVPGGVFRLGAEPGDGFVFDNEKWAHEVEVAPFRMARAPVTNAEYVAFVADDGYARRDFWSDAGWAWRGDADAHHPLYWIERGGDFALRRFDAVVPLAPHHPVTNVCLHEAEAFCRWAGRRLPTEAEWEFAATMAPDGAKRRFPWGDAPWGDADDAGRRANLDGLRLGPVDVAAFAAGDSGFRLPPDDRQRLGMDLIRLRALSRLLARRLRRLFRAVVREGQSAARRRLDHPIAAGQRPLPQLLPAPAPRHLRRLPHRGVVASRPHCTAATLTWF